LLQYSSQAIVAPSHTPNAHKQDYPKVYFQPMTENKLKIFILCVSNLAAPIAILAALGFLQTYFYFHLFRLIPDPDTSLTFWSAVLYFEYSIYEYLILILLSLLALGSSRFIRNGLFIVILLALVTNAAQILSFYYSHNYITKDVFANAGEVALVTDPLSLSIIALALFSGAILYLLLRTKTAANISSLAKGIAATIIISLAMSLLSFHSDAAKPYIKKKDAIVEFTLLEQRAPLQSMLLLLQNMLFNDESTALSLSKKDLAVAARYRIKLNPNSLYPLVKDYFYSEPLPFKSNKRHKKPNVIVFLLESLSTRKIGIHGAPFKEITPNIDTFASQSMMVENYYSHTAATYRGIRGQLCSMYPHYGGVGGWVDGLGKVPEVDVFCLADIFNQHGYESVFFSGNDGIKGGLEKQSLDFGFTDVYFRDRILKTHLSDELPKVAGYLSDYQILRSLTKYLKNRETETTPLFLSLYSVGTHTNLGIPDDGVPYPHKDNSVLHATYNLDQAFGEFWHYFKSSSYADNTIFILTADHSHFPSQPFIEIAGEDYVRVFFDTIPLMIYNPFLKLPGKFNAYNASSIDLAPSLLHMLQFPNQKNPFVGSSIFEGRGSDGFNRSFGGFADVLNIFTPGNPIAQFHYGHKNPKRIRHLFRTLKYFQEIERTNRVWHKRFE